MSSLRSDAWLGVAVVVSAIAITHGPSIGNGFVELDDDQYVHENPHVQGGLSREGLAWAFKVQNDRDTYFHPLTWLSLMLDHELFGLAPWGYHLVNLVLHAVAAALLLLAFALATGRPRPSAAAALLWGIHPLTVEGVAWVAERKTVLAGALAAGAVLAYVAYARRPSWRRLGVVALLQTASILAKPSLVVFPALALVLDLWPLGRIGRPRAGAGVPHPALSRIVAEKCALALVAVPAAIPAIVSTKHFDISLVTVPLSLRAANAFASIPRYLAAVAWPSGLSVYHPFPVHVPLPLARVVAGALLVALLTAGALLAARRRPSLLAGWLWFLVALSPAIGLKVVGMWPAWADRFAYLPLVGLAAAIAFAAADVAARASVARAMVIGGAACAAVALGAATVHQGRYWKDSLALFRRAAEIEPRSFEMQMHLGVTLGRAGRWQEALSHLELARQLNPLDAKYRLNLGLCLAALGRFPEAVEEMKAAVSLDPRNANAKAQLAMALHNLGRLAEAERHFRDALEIDANHPDALFRYAELLRTSDRPGQALPLYVRFLEIAPPTHAREREVASFLLGR